MTACALTICAVYKRGQAGAGGTWPLATARALKEQQENLLLRITLSTSVLGPLENMKLVPPLCNLLYYKLLLLLLLLWDFKLENPLDIIGWLIKGRMWVSTK